ncbi:leucine zipper putative tumor suppressor 1 [Spea bombifrons]|uniref:leucine zipper putative tumor suppressor 1 n=1 Tax=Spea bombifrons TaxID=233779 RepID=UPI00234AAB27|nr:leucine zipper putative tumor suppressor 1 [Spea bombifrons]
MGSVGSLLSGHGFNSKQGRGSQHRGRKPPHLKKLSRCSDGILRFGFSQESGHAKGGGSKMGRSEDFFYIKVSQKSHVGARQEYHGGVTSTEPESQSNQEYPVPTSKPCNPPPSMIHFPNRLELEMNALRPSPLKPGMRRNSAVTCYPAAESGPQLSLYYRPDRAREAESRAGHCVGGMSESGRNSMSSLPTHASKLGTACQLDALLMPTGRFGGSAHNITQSSRSNMLSLRAMSLSDGGNANKILSVPPKPGIRSPPSCEELARVEPGEKTEEGHRGGPSRSRQSSQRGQRGQHVLQIQVAQERESMESKMRGYEKEKKIAISPSIDDTQWEVCQKNGEIASLRQQLREVQEESSLRASEILSLKAQLRETKGRAEAQEQRAREAEERLRAEEEEREVREETASSEADLETLRTELEAERQNNEQMTDVFQRERKTWRDEKEKVIRYQRQLQQNYLHMCQRCQALEQRLRALSGEDLDDGPIITMPDMELSFQDILATEI